MSREGRVYLRLELTIDERKKKQKQRIENRKQKIGIDKEKKGCEDIGTQGRRVANKRYPNIDGEHRQK